MNSRALFLCLLALYFSAPAFASEGALCLQTFNVYGPAYAGNTHSRLDRLGDELARDPCEAIQFQELWKASQFTQIQLKLNPARLAGLWADTLRSDKKLTGLGSFFSGSVLMARSVLFRANNGNGFLDQIRGLTGVQKGFTVMEVQLDGQPPFLFANLHTHPLDEATRCAQMLELIENIYADPKSSEMPLLLTGDFNATPTGPELGLLEGLLLLHDAYAEIHGGYRDECTYCAANRYSWSRENRVIDFTLFRASLKMSLEPTNSEINLTGGNDPLSDHYGVRSHFRWADRPGEELLAANSEVVRDRKARAIESLLRAAGPMRNSKLDEVRAAAIRADQLVSELRDGTLTAAMDAAFRTP
jgi:endonuclease/exonuclease/phosphatase family metal-dependent hydrolase